MLYRLACSPGVFGTSIQRLILRRLACLSGVFRTSPQRLLLWRLACSSGVPRTSPQRLILQQLLVRQSTDATRQYVSHIHITFATLVNQLDDSYVQRLRLQQLRHLWLLMFCTLHVYLSSNCYVVYRNLISLDNFVVQCFAVSCYPALIRTVRLVFFVNLFTYLVDV